LFPETLTAAVHWFKFPEEVPQSNRLSTIADPPSLVIVPLIVAEVVVFPVAARVCTVGTVEDDWTIKSGFPAGCQPVETPALSTIRYFQPQLPAAMPVAVLVRARVPLETRLLE
jgi:hypothetical protein